MGGLPRPVALTGADQVVRTTSSIYRGLTVRETTGGAGAVLRVFDHASAASGTLLQTVALGNGESLTVVHPAGLWAIDGIYVDVVSGAVEGAIYVG
ncbi:hypothetical protein [Planobispora longispora]|uniref:Uncharacterized protein n=1 Tax=Planobispora longispora TaxID=28887 RepID=A0A8J3W563_9ACTN|nr:hypothetical protein [Planobispora longispora]BFE85825.1 hypothetical protein GCM10020093_084260 [Planobispora longispora]GIH76143.1 hypothetical protein Plo01_25720 [Planobispora longispora]